VDFEVTAGTKLPNPRRQKEEEEEEETYQVPL
jgi:hypothetical protein